MIIQIALHIWMIHMLKNHLYLPTFSSTIKNYFKKCYCIGGGDSIILDFLVYNKP